MQTLATQQQAYHLNPNLFFYLRDGEFIVWDYLNHQQWIVKSDYINALERIAKGQSISVSMTQDLLQSGMVSAREFSDLHWGWDIVSKIYHLSSSDIFQDVQKSEDEFVEEYLATCEQLDQEEIPAVNCDYKFDACFDIRVDQTPLGEVFRKRKTTRNFDGSSITYDELGSLLFTSCGEIHESWEDLQQAGYMTHSGRRSFPSGGGLYPIRYIVLALNVEDIIPGVYEYVPQANGLKLLKLLDKHLVFNDLTDILNSQFFCKGLAAGIFFVPDFSKEWEKYPHSRSYRDVFLDIAHCSQNVLLAATALELRTWITAAFKDEKLRNFLGIKEASTYPAEFIGIGHGENHSLPEAFRIRVKDS